jgi:putative transposase
LDEKNLRQSSDPTSRKSNVDFTDEYINISRQAELLYIYSSSIYRKPPEQKEVSEPDLLIMKRIDEIHTAHPTWGYRTITITIRRNDKIVVNKKKVQHLMQVMVSIQSTQSPI